MAEHEELHDEDVIVVMTNEDGDERYYREEMIIPIGEDRFAVLIALTASSEETFSATSTAKRSSPIGIIISSR